VLIGGTATASCGPPLHVIERYTSVDRDFLVVGRGFGERMHDRLRAQLDTSFQMIRNAGDRGIPILSGSDTGNVSAFSHGKWHGKEAELLVKQVGMTPMEGDCRQHQRRCCDGQSRGRGRRGCPRQAGRHRHLGQGPDRRDYALQCPAEEALIIKDGRIVDTEGGGFRQLSEEPPRARMFFAG
jgi:hypothetical protein